MTNFLAKSEPIRRYLYGLLGPALAVLVAYGFIDDSAVALLVALGAAVLVPAGVETARMHTTPLVGSYGDTGDRSDPDAPYTSGHR